LSKTTKHKIGQTKNKTKQNNKIKLINKIKQTINNKIKLNKNKTKV